MKLNRKLEQTILYIARVSQDDPHFGIAKLTAILFYADFEAYRRLGHSITGATYKHFDRGPAPKLSDITWRYYEAQP